jgi:hypothetical protein
MHRVKTRIRDRILGTGQNRIRPSDPAMTGPVPPVNIWHIIGIIGLLADAPLIRSKSGVRTADSILCKMHISSQYKALLHALYSKLKKLKKPRKNMSKRPVRNGPGPVRLQKPGTGAFLVSRMDIDLRLAYLLKRINSHQH